ncbi:hypothetical protein DB347_23495 [Opitutaceae bacterium EW11]|nr:hypothetical protein DB347_23495 [Opitutaceae bacterium EW11]
MSPENYVQLASREFNRLKGLADRAMVQIGDAQFFALPGEGDNSVAIIVKHVGGNLLSRWTDFLTSDGEKPGRNRDTEFQILAGETRAPLMEQWEAGWRALFAALSTLEETDLTRQVKIRGEPLTVLQAINRQLTHYAYHVGQIVYVAKHFCGASWKTLSIPLGTSAEFNRSPAKYLG